MQEAAQPKMNSSNTENFFRILYGMLITKLNDGLMYMYI
jgi:hypothetical protein